MTKYGRSWIKKMILVFAMLFVFGYSPAVYAEEEPKQAPGQELMGEGQEEMSFEDMIGTMEKPEAEKPPCSMQSLLPYMVRPAGPYGKPKISKVILLPLKPYAMPNIPS